MSSGKSSPFNISSTIQIYFPFLKVTETRILLFNLAKICHPYLYTLLQGNVKNRNRRFRAFPYKSTNLTLISSFLSSEIFMNPNSFIPYPADTCDSI